VKTFSPRPKDIDRRWYVVDARNQVLGRLATQVAHILRGKHKPIFAPHVDVGDHVIVINAEKVRLTGRKAQHKLYSRHTGYPGGLRQTVYEDMMKTYPERIIEHAVRGMLPDNRIGRQMFRKLKVYVGGSHPHLAQNPRPLEIRK